jgi:hypothetical protein
MAEPITVTVDAKGMPLPPIDPNVPLPPSVKAAKEAAEAIHAQAYPGQATLAPPPPASPAPQSPPPPPPPQAPPANEPRADWDLAKWQQHARSMEGRFKQSQDTVNSLQGTMTEMGDELVRLQNTSRQNVAPLQQPPPPVQHKMITPQDVETYGEDWLNTAARAAMDAVKPQLSQLQQQNQFLQKQLRKQTVNTINGLLDAEIPNWPQINTSPEFKNWLRLRDIYSGTVRQDLLNDAFRASDASRVLQFFRGFLNEEAAVGNTKFLSGQEPALNAPPRNDPAIALNTLTAPGHAKPAVGTPPNAPAEPIFITRGQIQQFYNNVRKGVYVGREQDYHNDQAFIMECQRLGRIKG